MAWWHDDVGSSLDVRSSLHDLYNLSSYCIPSLIRQFGQFSSNVYKGILDGVGWLLNKLYEPIFVGSRLRQTVHGFYAHIKSFISLELDMNLSCGCLLYSYLFRLFNFFPILSHLSTLCHFNSGELYPKIWIVVPPVVGVLIWKFYLVIFKYHHSFYLHLMKKEDSLLSHCVICCCPEKNVFWRLLSTTLYSDENHRVVGPCHL